MLIFNILILVCGFLKALVSKMINNVTKQPVLEIFWAFKMIKPLPFLKSLNKLPGFFYNLTGKLSMQKKYSNFHFCSVFSIPHSSLDVSSMNSWYIYSSRTFSMHLPTCILIHTHTQKYTFCLKHEWYTLSAVLKLCFYLILCLEDFPMLVNVGQLYSFHYDNMKIISHCLGLFVYECY